MRRVKGFPEYFVSEDGRVFSRHSRYGNRLLELRQMKATNGYRKVTLYRKEPKAVKQESVHVLVAEAFIGPRPKGYDVCHNDGDKSNNHVSNLRYDTPKGNNRDKLVHGTYQGGERCGQAKLKDAQVIAIRQERRDRNTPFRKLASRYGVTSSAIYSVCHGKTWKHVV